MIIDDAMSEENAALAAKIATKLIDFAVDEVARQYDSPDERGTDVMLTAMASALYRMIAATCFLLCEDDVAKARAMVAITVDRMARNSHAALKRAFDQITERGPNGNN